VLNSKVVWGSIRIRAESLETKAETYDRFIVQATVPSNKKMRRIVQLTNPFYSRVHFVTSAGTLGNSNSSGPKLNGNNPPTVSTLTPPAD
jgi:hypothetical protein